MGCAQIAWLWNTGTEIRGKKGKGRIKVWTRRVWDRNIFLLEFILCFLNKFTDAGVQTLFWYSLEIAVFSFSEEFFVGCDFCHQFLVKKKNPGKTCWKIRGEVCSHFTSLALLWEKLMWGGRRGKLGRTETTLIFHCANTMLKIKPMWVWHLHVDGLMCGMGMGADLGLDYGLGDTGGFACLWVECTVTYIFMYLCPRVVTVISASFVKWLKSCSWTRTGKQ